MIGYVCCTQRVAPFFALKLGQQNAITHYKMPMRRAGRHKTSGLGWWFGVGGKAFGLFLDLSLFVICEQK